MQRKLEKEGKPAALSVKLIIELAAGRFFSSFHNRCLEVESQRCSKVPPVSKISKIQQKNNIKMIGHCMLC